jgi:uncharacterized protein (DUF2147 family)
MNLTAITNGRSTMRVTTILAAAAIAVAGISAASAADNGKPEGTWISADGGAKVRLASCGNGLCGKIVWLRERIDQATGKPKTDKHNPEETNRSRPMLGLQVISGMKPDGENRYAGQIYNADDGKTYRSKLTLVAWNKAKVEGCVLVFCKGETWTRVD